MLNIYLTRHGETQWNIENRLQGSKNSQLTDKGIEHAIMLGNRLRNIDFSAIYTSPLERALQTANYIKSDKDVPIYTIENLKEMNFGDWEGKTKDEIEAVDNYKNEYHNFWHIPQMYNHKPHYGEGLITFKRRVEEVLSKVISSNSDGNILIVTHAVVIKAILSFTMDISTDKMWDPPFIHGTSLTIFQWDGEQFNFKMIGDISHFKNETE
ncbi:histidine phosphatase family protein [Solibacillus isronensis]|uniref:histidine phosphatase family protein n=1 Tax=Solibacillus isronensis TaxID=412383 RepID=UPI00203E1C80|nr:histidine phosphatase family protein [Solibacillus isronensis]MCM3721161.1 histidine phosphatase family protein [Solibacillus isronensis]